MCLQVVRFACGGDDRTPGSLTSVTCAVQFVAKYIYVYMSAGTCGMKLICVHLHFACACVSAFLSACAAPRCIAFRVDCGYVEAKCFARERHDVDVLPSFVMTARF